MRIIAVCFLLFCVVVSSSWARLGETKEQIKKRFGPPAGEWTNGFFISHPAWSGLLYLKGGTTMRVVYYKNVSSRETYRMDHGESRDFTAQEIQTLLAESVEGHNWTFKMKSAMNTWTRDDGASAVYLENFFDISSKDCPPALLTAILHAPSAERD